MYKRLLSLCLAAALLLGLFALTPVTANAASDMTASEDCINLIKELEGFSPCPYLDTDGKYTIGYGTRCPDDQVEHFMENPMTQEHAQAELLDTIAGYQKEVNAFIDRHSLNYNQGQFDAVVSLVFNCGSSWLTKGTALIRALSDGAEGNDLIYAFCIYSMSGGTRSLGHVRRRLSEANMYLNSEYSRTPPNDFAYVLYNANGGVLDTYDVQGYDTDLTAAPVPVATYGSYEFLGWYTSPTGGKKVTTLDASTKSMTLYAHWGAGKDSNGKPVEPPAPTVPEGSDITAVEIKVTGSRVNLRQGPGLNYSVVKTVNKGTELTVTAIEADSQYTWGKTAAGWICLKYTDYDAVTEKPTEAPTTKPTEPTEAPTTKPTEAPTTKPTEAPTTEPTEAPTTKPAEDQKPQESTGVKKVYGTIIGTDTLNIRSTPDGKIVGKLNRGDKVEILEQKTVDGRGWGRCSKGWICVRTYVKLETVTEESTTPAPSKPAAPEAPADGKLYGTVINTASLNIRSTPDGKIVGKLAKGDKVEIYERKTVEGRSWGRCDRGWICLRTYVKLEGSTASGSNSSSNNTGSSNSSSNSGSTSVKKVYATVVGTDTLNIRSTPDGKIVGKLKEGDKVEILEQKMVSGRNWGKCSKGWICLRTFAKLETVSESTGSSSNTSSNTGSADKGRTGTVDASALNIRSKAGTSNPVVGKLYRGESVTILEEVEAGGTTWGRCSKGWVCLDYVDF